MHSWPIPSRPQQVPCLELQQRQHMWKVPLELLRGPFGTYSPGRCRMLCDRPLLLAALPFDPIGCDRSSSCPCRTYDDGAGYKDQVRRFRGVYSCIHLHHRDAAHIFYFERYPYRNDHLRPDEYDLWKFQENHSCDVYTCCNIHTELYLYLRI